MVDVHALNVVSEGKPRTLSRREQVLAEEAARATEGWREAAERRLKEATPGPWEVWDGPRYFGGGADLCIGAGGGKWLANMDERHDPSQQRAAHDFDASVAHDHDRDVCDICSFSDEVDREQRANAELIVHAPEDLKRALAEIDTLRRDLLHIACGIDPFGASGQYGMEAVRAHDARMKRQ